jgi:DNA (cytosine-5)-methyltransferase 1
MLLADLAISLRKNPHEIIPAKSADKEEAHRRLSGNILQVEAVSEKGNAYTLPGFFGGVDYKTEPMNRYQRWIRSGMGDRNGKEQQVNGHYTKRFGAKLVEA